MAVYSPLLMSFKRNMLLSALAVFVGTVTMLPAFAQEGAEAQATSGLKELGAGLAFGLAGVGAAIGLGYVGSAGIAALSENPAMQSRVFIFLGMVESIAIYGIVIVLIILG
jgi:V/A-type H+-transporting ATPase subunit K